MVPNFCSYTEISCNSAGNIDFAAEGLMAIVNASITTGVASTGVVCTATVSKVAVPFRMNFRLMSNGDTATSTEFA